MRENHREPEVVPEEKVPVVAREMGSPRHATNRRRWTREGPDPACVQTPFEFRVAHAGGGRMNQHPAVVPSSRRGKNLQLVANEEESGCPKRVSGRHVVRGRQSPPTLEVRPVEQARLVKTVNIQVRWAAAHAGQDRRLPSVARHSRL